MTNNRFVVGSVEKKRGLLDRGIISKSLATAFRVGSEIASIFCAVGEDFDFDLYGQ